MSRLIGSLRGHFSTAHFYKQSQWSEELNRSEFGLCYSEFGHGHNYAIDVAFSAPKEFAKADGRWNSIVSKTESILGSVLLDFDHRHLNFTHPEFVSKVAANSSRTPDLISTTEVLAEVLHQVIHKKWLTAAPELSFWSHVTLMGVQIRENDSLASATDNALVCRARGNENWSIVKTHMGLQLGTGICRSVEFSVFDSAHPLEAAAALSDFVQRESGRIKSLEELCCAIQENLGLSVLLKTASGYFLFSEAVGE